MSIPLYVVCIVCLCLCSSYFSATETAFSSLNKIRIKNMASEGNKKAALVLKLSDNFDSLISTILVGNNIVNITATTLSGLLFALLIANEGLASTVSTIVMTVIVLIFGEITPKTLAKKNPESFAMAIAPSINFIRIILIPFVKIFGLWQILLNKVFKKKDESGITDDELITYVEEAQTDGGIDEYEGELIRSAIEFDDLTVNDILTPRVDVKAIAYGVDMDTAMQIFKKSGYSRLPVYKGTIDNITGVLNEKDFYNAYFNGEKVINKAVSANIVYATPFMKISVLLRRLQKDKTHMAIVVDEFGGTQGIVTLEDILEELVGDIWDEHDEVVEYFKEIEENKYMVDGDVSLSDFFDYFNLKADPEDYDVVQLSGLVATLIGKLPEKGDIVDFMNLKIHVTAVEHMKAERCEVEVMPAEEKEEDEDESVIESIINTIKK